MSDQAAVWSFDGSQSDPLMSTGRETSKLLRLAGKAWKMPVCAVSGPAYRGWRSGNWRPR